MVEQFRLPDVGEGVAEGELVSWLVDEGDTVVEDQPVAEVETDKALVEVPSPYNGTVAELLVAEGEIVPVGTVIITFNVEGDDDSTAATQTKPDESESPDEQPTTGRVFAPPRIRRLAREKGVDISQVRGTGPGGRITAADLEAASRADSSPDETATEREDTPDSSASTTAEASSNETSTLEHESEQPEPESEQPEPIETEGTVDHDGVPARDRTLAAPATRQLAREAGVDLDAVPASEERDGEAFVTPEAVMAYAEAQQQAQAADTEAVATGEMEAGERREPFRGVRKTIAEAMEHSMYTAPHVTHHDEVDVTRLVELRERLKPVAEEQGIHLTYMPFILRAVVAALEAFPILNAMIDDENEEIVYHDAYHIGIATATDVGLMVPVLEDVDQKGLLQLASEMSELVQKARDRTIAPEELRGSTFTVTNVGGIGGEYATPILNYPEAGILGIGEIKRKPRVVTADDGTESIEPRSVLALSLSFDHRLVDGAEGARFTNTVMKYLETPELLLLE